MKQKVETLKSELQAKTAERDRLLADRDERAVELEALQAERTTAVRGLAAGDEKQHDVITAADNRIELLKRRVEGLEQLLLEAQEEATAVEGFLEQAEGEMEAAQHDYVACRMQDEAQAFLAGLTAREKRICEMFIGLGKALADYNVESFRINLLPDIGNSVGQDRLSHISETIMASMQRSGLCNLSQPGHPFTIPVTQFIEAPEGMAGPVLNVRELAIARNEERYAHFAAEFQTQQ